MQHCIVVDNRWQGDHGIGRYGQEIIRRLPEDRITLYNQGSPLSLADTAVAAFNNRRGFSYTPGFNFFNASPSKSIITVHDLAHLEIPQYRSAKNKLYYESLIKPTCRHAPFVFTVSEVSRQKIAAWTGIASERIIVTSNGASAAFRQDGAVYQTNHPYLLSVGSSKPHKNTRRLLEAFSRANLPQECKLFLVGPFPNLPDRVKNDRIVVQGALNDNELAALYRGCHGLVQPSLYEGFGLPLAEGMACGVPLVASDIPIFHEVAGGVADFFDPYSIDALGDALEALFRVDPDREARIARGIEASKRYRWDKVANIVAHKLMDLR